MSEFHAEASQATASEGLSEDPYVAARAGYEPTTLPLTGIDSTNSPPRPIISLVVFIFDVIIYTCIVMCCGVKRKSVHLLKKTNINY